ncbi:MAG TPA: vanadium-dependent haloperoxidase [Thermoleophilaceae bacterium]
MLGVGAAIVLLAAAGCGSDGERIESKPADPEAATWDTWVLESPGEIAVPAPPAEGSPEAAADERELERARGERDPAAEREVQKWNGPPAVKPWLELAMRFVANRPKDPPSSSRAYALVSVAMYDATVAAWHWKKVHGREAPAGTDPLVPAGSMPSYPSEHAAMAGAASEVLAYAFPDEPRLRLEEMADQAARSRVVAGVSRPSDVKAGLELGRRVAQRVIERARRDRVERKWDGRRPHGIRYWSPPPGSVSLPVQPLAGSWGTWVLRSGRELRPEPPPRVGTPEFEKEAREVVRVRASLTPEQKRVASFWAGGEGTPLPAGVWNQVILNYIAEENLSEPRAARVFALANVAMSDAGVASWDAKFTYWSPRPENAIRDTGIDRDWKPYLQTPLFPAYTSGHATYSAAVGEVLAHLFPADAKDWRAKAEEAAISRVYGGIHFPADSRVGSRMGREIGRRVVEHARRDGAER